jgi:hypothetical protein
MRATCTPRPNTYLVNTETLVPAVADHRALHTAVFCLPGTKDIEQVRKKMSKDWNAQIKQNVDHIAVQSTRLWENEKKIQQLTKQCNNLKQECEDLETKKLHLMTPDNVKLQREIVDLRYSEMLHKEHVKRLVTELNKLDELHKEQEKRLLTDQEQLGELRLENTWKENYETEFTNVSRDLYFILTELNKYVNGEQPYNLNAENNENLIVRNEDHVGRRQSVEQASHSQQGWELLEDGRWVRVVTNRFWQKPYEPFI